MPIPDASIEVVLAISREASNQIQHSSVASGLMTGARRIVCWFPVSRETKKADMVEHP
jgi:hypothetical protein